MIWVKYNTNYFFKIIFILFIIYFKFVYLYFSVEKTSKELINDTLNLNRSFQMNYFEKYSKCDKIKHISHEDKLKLRM